MSYCLICNKQWINNVIAPTGHKYSEDFEWIEPTCTLPGGKAYICQVCGDKKIDPSTMKPALGHTEVIDMKVDPTCMKEGLTEGSHCFVCGEIIIKQTKIEKTDHIDKNYDGTCDVCNTFIEKIIEISTKNEFVEIGNDLSASYVLKNDIILDGNWMGLGTFNKPFTGKLYGNGFSIINLSFNGGLKPGGLFISNKGLIDGLTLKDINISTYGHTPETATYACGGIAAYNYGVIKNCKIDGSNTINVTNDWQLTDDLCSILTFNVGAICGVNKGSIEQCEVSGTMTNLFRVNNYTFHNGMISNNPECYVTSNIYYGNIAGINDGTIEDTKSICDQTITMSAKALSACGADVSYATIKSFSGSLVGVNNSTLKNCSAKKYIETHSKDQDNNNQANIEIIQAAQYEGIIGVNNGKIEKFTTL